MKLLICTYQRLKLCHTNVWIDIIDILLKKYDWNLLDITNQARKHKRKKNNYKKLSIIKELENYNNVTELFFFNLSIFFSDIFFDIDKIKNIKIYSWIEELWHDNKVTIYDSKFMSLIFSPSPKNNLIKYIPNQKAIIHEINYSCTYDFDLKINPKPKQKILFSGTISDVYPHRQEIIKKYNNHEKTRLLIDFISMKQKIFKEKYAEYINKYIASIATPGIVNGDYFIVKKFFEIACTGSLLVIFTDKESIKYINNIGFFDKQNCIISTNLKDLFNKIEFILDNDNRKFLDNIRKNGKKFVLDNFMVDNTVERIDKIIKKI